MTTESEFKRKRCFSFAVVLIYKLFSACELVMILPHLRSYLQILGLTNETCFGLILCAYSVMSAITGLLGGCLVDLYPFHTKFIVMTGIMFRIMGNFQYTLGIGVWNVVIARVITGFSGAAGTAVLAEFGRITTREERAMFLSITNAAFYFGILISPALEFLLSLINFDIFGHAINVLNAPGFIMFFLWIFLLFATAFFFTNLTEEFKEFDIHRIYETRFPLEIMSENKESSCNNDGPVNISSKYKQEILTQSFVFLMTFAFMVFFCQLAFQESLTVYLQKYFGFTLWENTIIFAIVTFEALVVFIGVAFLSNYVRETTMLASGLFLMVTALIWLTTVMPQFEKGNETHMIYFLAGTFVIMLGIPVAMVANMVLASKILSSETQGLGQGIRRLSSFMALIIAPYWAAETTHKPHVLLGLPLALVLLNGILLLACYTNLHKSEENNPLEYPPTADKAANNESAPLLEDSSSP